jgi:hypothetical protein
MTSWGIWSIDEELFEWIKLNLKLGSTLVEIGSGEASKPLSELYKLYSIEENIEWLNKFHDNYIYAPIINSWYDIDIIENNLPTKIDAILIDGPAYGERRSFINHIEIFLDKNPILLIFDDVHRESDMLGYLDVLDYLKSKNYKIETNIINSVKQFAYIKII